MLKFTYALILTGFVAIVQSAAQSAKSPVQARPNILFIVIDDASWSLSPPNLPSYVVLPGFDSVRLEGATISSTYCTYPLCNPSRNSFLTSLYAHQHGALDNGTKVNPKFKFFTQSLHDAGYHVQVCGKFANTQYKYLPWADQKRWMGIQKIAYKNPTMYFSNGNSKTIIGSTTTIIGDTANKWLASVDTPFCFWEGIIVPHTPTTPLPSSKNKFKNNYIPLKTYTPFIKDYPSFTYSDPDKFYMMKDSDDVQKQREKNYECYVDIDATITTQLNTLKSRGLLNNTMVMIINDNGYENGEHLILGKEKPYFESLGLPCYIRYKPWFRSGSVIDTVMFTNIDVGPTLLDLAGVHDPVYSAQQMGSSIRTRMTQGRSDSIFYYEDIRRTNAILNNGSESPSFRGVHTFSYNYVRYHCNSLTDQLFDLKNDPNETTNVINDSNYVAAVAHYRFLLDSLSIATHDTVSSDTFYLPCTLISTPPPVRAENNNIPLVASSAFSIFPNPADRMALVTITFSDPVKSTIALILCNSIGEVIGSRKLKEGKIVETSIDVKSVSDGLYFIRIDHDGVTDVKPLIVDHNDSD